MVLPTIVPARPFVIEVATFSVTVVYFWSHDGFVGYLYRFLSHMSLSSIERTRPSRRLPGQHKQA